MEKIRLIIIFSIAFATPFLVSKCKKALKKSKGEEEDINLNIDINKRIETTKNLDEKTHIFEKNFDYIYPKVDEHQLFGTKTAMGLIYHKFEPAEEIEISYNKTKRSKLFIKLDSDISDLKIVITQPLSITVYKEIQLKSPKEEMEINLDEFEEDSIILKLTGRAENCKLLIKLINKN
ncbi:hypothetical protein [Clostridium massiliamazoniense]|uniref:hypothetical protein n=1 Tax=Clostridium massiliamazoniense TaxID=1347366 RepID=UPI0006D782F8|nr:hypothetical protein [Clostridium massiliamazoniense]